MKYILVFRIIFCLLWLIIINTVRTYGNNLLCRSCGSLITNDRAIIHKNSPLNGGEYIQNVVGVNATIQKFINPANEEFDVMIVNGATLMYHGDPSFEATWYPNYQWTICLCRKCRKHMGWYFSKPRQEKDGFIGLILDRLISEAYVDQMILPPGIDE
uniref:CULT domain-containing protein n=1 Tax=Strongyloides venezuelensis TaxID=75913 RepID=A0A0K0EUC4_STRVS